MTKITRTTFKSFIKNNAQDLFVKNVSYFDGMTDCVEHNRKAEFVKASPGDHNPEHTLGIDGVWLVNGSRDYFQPYQDDEFEGIEVSNACGSFIVAKPKLN